MLWIFVRIPSPQHMFFGVNKGKKAFYHLSFWYRWGLFIAANSSWGTNAVVITRVFCNEICVSWHSIYMLPDICVTLIISNVYEQYVWCLHVKCLKWPFLLDIWIVCLWQKYFWKKKKPSLGTIWCEFTVSEAHLSKISMSRIKIKNFWCCYHNLIILMSPRLIWDWKSKSGKTESQTNWDEFSIKFIFQWT